jgi:hypothetical protein
MLMLISAVATSVELLRINKRSKFENLIFITLIFSILDIVSNYVFIDFIKSEKMFERFANINQYLFYLFETLTIIFFYNELNGKKNNIKNTIIFGGFSIATTLLFFTISTIDSSFFTLTLVIVFELLFINFSFGYFFTKNLEVEYSSNTKRLVIINYGLFIFVNFTTPFYFISIFLSKQNLEAPDLNFITYIGYIILYSTIIKSLKWKI